MRKYRKNYSNIKRETRKNLIIDIDVDEPGSIKLKKLVFECNIRRIQKFEDLRRSFESSKLISIPNIP
jgi:hypothetical protein